LSIDYIIASASAKIDNRIIGDGKVRPMTRRPYAKRTAAEGVEFSREYLG
jgi:hypothetical protein